MMLKTKRGIPFTLSHYNDCPIIRVLDRRGVENDITPFPILGVNLVEQWRWYVMGVFYIRPPFRIPRFEVRYDPPPVEVNEEVPF